MGSWNSIHEIWKYFLWACIYINFKYNRIRYVDIKAKWALLITLTDGDNFFNVQKAVQINEFDGVTNIDSLNIKLIDDGTYVYPLCLLNNNHICRYEYLCKRGELYERVGLGHHFMDYKGSMFR